MSCHNLPWFQAGLREMRSLRTGCLTFAQLISTAFIFCRIASYNNYRHSRKCFLRSKIDYFHCICDAEKALANERRSRSASHHKALCCVTATCYNLTPIYLRQTRAPGEFSPQTLPLRSHWHPKLCSVWSGRNLSSLPLLGIEDDCITVTAGSPRLFLSFLPNLAKLLHSE